MTKWQELLASFFKKILMNQSKHYVPTHFLTHAHDVRWLTKQWQKLARQCGAHFHTISTSGNLQIPVFRTPAFEINSDKGIYISAGIHGDEVAPIVALLVWAERLLIELPHIPLLLFPILNPWGVLENSRRDAEGMDLNRIWHDAQHPLRQLIDYEIGDHRFDSMVTLHEDYDAQGIYLYEPLKKGQVGIGPQLLEAASALIPLEPRKNIEGRKVSFPGVIQRSSIPKILTQAMPEALYFHQLFRDKPRIFTFETPSEWDLLLRIQTHICFLDSILTISN